MDSGGIRKEEMVNWDTLAVIVRKTGAKSGTKPAAKKAVEIVNGKADVSGLERIGINWIMELENLSDLPER